MITSNRKLFDIPIYVFDTINTSTFNNDNDNNDDDNDDDTNNNDDDNVNLIGFYEKRNLLMDHYQEMQYQYPHL